MNINEWIVVLMKLAAGLTICQLLFVLWNVRRLPQLGSGHSGDAPARADVTSLPLVSVLIPARNEARNIAECIQAVIASQCQGFELEVLVLNDRSEDDTREQVLQLSALDDRIKLLEGNELPPGWLGKSYACHQLAQAAQGEWLLFIDADIRLYPHSIAASFREGESLGRGLITGFAYQKTGSWLEKLVVPMMSFVITCHLPIPLVQSSHDPRFVAAHGAFMMIHRTSYFSSGGHQMIRTSLIDDMELARAVKRAGHPVRLVRLIGHAQMRMYTNASEVWHGYCKNIYEGTGRNGLLLAGLMAGYVLCYVFPWAAVPWLILTGQLEHLLLALLAVLAGAAVKRVSDASSGQPAWLCLLLPLSIISLLSIAAASWWSGVTGKGYLWKGRRVR